MRPLSKLQGFLVLQCFIAACAGGPTHSSAVLPSASRIAPEGVIALSPAPQFGLSDVQGARPSTPGQSG